MAMAIPIAGAVIGGLSAGVSGLSQYRAGQFNAAVAKQNQKFALQQSKLEEDRFRRQSRFQQGLARTQAGANGGNMTGSALDIINDNVLNNELDAAIIRMQGQLQARQWGIEAKEQKSASKMSLWSTPLNIAGALMGSGAFGGGGEGGTGSVGTSPFGSYRKGGNWGGPRT